MKLQLNIEKALAEMARVGMSKSDLARELKMSRQAVNHYFKKRPVSAAVKFAKIFHLPPKDFIK